MAYTEEQCLQRIEEQFQSGNLCKLYDKPFVKSWNGKTTDTKREYQEIFAEYIYKRLDAGKLPMIGLCDVKKYCKNDRKYVERDNEEGVQRDFYLHNRKLDDKFGKCIWFELPANKNGQGKGVDLVYYNAKTAELNIFELKYNSKETFLRALMEIQTYYQRVDWPKAIKEFKSRDLIESEDIAKINKYVLVNDGCVKIMNKFNALTDNSYVQKLMDEFNVELVTY